MNIFVAKLSSATTNDDLAALFQEYGTVLSAKVIMDKETGNSKCFGFVEMEDNVEAMNAINALNDTEFHGRKIVVKKAHAKEDGGHKEHRGGRRPLQHHGSERHFASHRIRTEE